MSSQFWVSDIILKDDYTIQQRFIAARTGVDFRNNRLYNPSVFEMGEELVYYNIEESDKVDYPISLLEKPHDDK